MILPNVRIIILISYTSVYANVFANVVTYSIYYYIYYIYIYIYIYIKLFTLNFKVVRFKDKLLIINYYR